MDRAKSLLYAKGFYFFYYGGWACLAPFLTLHYKSQGFTGAQIGLLASISPFMTLVAAPFWGGLADATRRYKWVLIGAMIGTGLSVLALSQAHGFWMVALTVALYAFFTSTIIPLVDNSVVNLLGERKDQYGAQRLWGAIGWGASAPIIGWIISMKGLSFSFVGYLALLSVAVLTTFRLPIWSAANRASYWTGLRKILADRRWYLFLLITFLSGAGLSVISNFLFLYMDELHASQTVMGLSLTTATISEVIVLSLSGKMIRRWGPRGMLLISLTAYVVRAYSYSAAHEPWQVLIIQLLHGLTFSTMLVAGVSFASEIAPEGMGATAQGLFTSMSSGFGGMTGAIAGGILLEHVGGQGMYFWTGSVVLIGLLVFLFFGRRLSASNQPTIKKAAP